MGEDNSMKDNTDGNLTSEEQTKRPGSPKMTNEGTRKNEDSHYDDAQGALCQGGLGMLISSLASRNLVSAKDSVKSTSEESSRVNPKQGLKSKDEKCGKGKPTFDWSSMKTVDWKKNDSKKKFEGMKSHDSNKYEEKEERNKMNRGFNQSSRGGFNRMNSGGPPFGPRGNFGYNQNQRFGMPPHMGGNFNQFGSGPGFGGPRGPMGGGFRPQGPGMNNLFKENDQNLDDVDLEAFCKEETKQLCGNFGGNFILCEVGDEGVSYICQLCYVEMTDKKGFEKHCTGMKHLRKRAVWERKKSADENDENASLGKKRNFDDNQYGDSEGPGMSKNPKLSEPHPVKKEKLGSGPTGALLRKLANCVIKNPDDEELALSVMKNLAKAVREYNLSKGVTQAVNMMMEAEVKVESCLALKISLNMMAPGGQNSNNAAASGNKPVESFNAFTTPPPTFNQKPPSATPNYSNQSSAYPNMSAYPNQASVRPYQQYNQYAMNPPQPPPAAYSLPPPSTYSYPPPSITATAPPNMNYQGTQVANAYGYYSGTTNTTSSPTSSQSKKAFPPPPTNPETSSTSTTLPQTSVLPSTAVPPPSQPVAAAAATSTSATAVAVTQDTSNQAAAYANYGYDPSYYANYFGRQATPTAAPPPPPPTQ